VAVGERFFFVYLVDTHGHFRIFPLKGYLKEKI